MSVLFLQTLYLCFSFHIHHILLSLCEDGSFYQVFLQRYCRFLYMLLLLFQFLYYHRLQWQIKQLAKQPQAISINWQLVKSQHKLLVFLYFFFFTYFILFYTLVILRHAALSFCVLRFGVFSYKFIFSFVFVGQLLFLIFLWSIKKL